VPSDKVPMNPQPRIGVGVLVFKGNQVLLGKRKNSHGEGTWQAPGGHLEFGEKPEDCAIREVLEETGLSITDVKRGPYTNDLFQAENRHYITLFMIANHQHGEPSVMEPDKCEGWKWFDWSQLPSPLFLPIVNLIRQGFVVPFL